MLKVNLFDTNFAHSLKEDGFDTCSAGRKPREIEWVRNRAEWDGITVFTDNLIGTHFPSLVKSKIKIAWLIEPPSIHPKMYQEILKCENQFDYIFTFKNELLKRNPKKYKRFTMGSLRVPEEHWNIHPKHKLVSIIASNKKSTEGHIMRHQIISKYKDVIDAWGFEYNKFTSKLDPLKDYYFSIAIMNMKEINYFTEILTDCFALGTVPIFWGCPNIKEFFNIKGIICFNEIKELDKILPSLNYNLYQSMMKGIEDNLERVKKYASTDDMMANEFKKIIRDM